MHGAPSGPGEDERTVAVNPDNGELLAVAEFIHERCFCAWFDAARALVPGGVCAGTEKVYAAAENVPTARLAALPPAERAIVDYLTGREATLLLMLFCGFFTMRTMLTIRGES